MQVFKKLFISLFFVLLFSCNTPSRPNYHTIESKPPVDQTSRFREHIVEKGDSLFSISQKYKVSMTDISIDNKLRGSHDVLIGRVLKIRVGAHSKDTQVPANHNKLINPENFSSNNTAPNEPSNSNVKNFLGNVPYMLIPASTGYQTSIKGNMTKNYYSKHYGTQFHGVEIRSNLAQSVKAIHNGVVVFVAENFSSYGRSIAVANSRNEISFIYGLDSISSKVGDVVMKGGTLGSIASGKTLGIKIMREGIFQDPSKIIPGIQ